MNSWEYASAVRIATITGQAEGLAYLIKSVTPNCLERTRALNTLDEVVRLAIKAVAKVQTSANMYVDA